MTRARSRAEKLAVIHVVCIDRDRIQQQQEQSSIADGKPIGAMNRGDGKPIDLTLVAGVNIADPTARYPPKQRGRKGRSMETSLTVNSRLTASAAERRQ